MHQAQGAVSSTWKHDLHGLNLVIQKKKKERKKFCLNQEEEEEEEEEEDNGVVKRIRSPQNSRP